ncbi:MAG: sigma 54-interacting transcriptional regulator [Verrucomicrobia bacterium]|nr:sigma 54-interacting transcriptional regulator [Verrucomicrobiota bacterium]MDE3099850.1 sigma 54-interacting transcriptional regulator [Verrucomicrobiota bacterium]
METNSDVRFDPDFAVSLLLEIAQEQSLDGVLRKLVCRILSRPAVARVRIWLINKGDICATCVRRPDCPDQTRCLHAVAGGSNLIGQSKDEQEYTSMTDRYARIPLNVGVVGKIGSTGRQTVLRNLDQDPGELAYIDWLDREQIRGFNGVPIIHKGAVLGVIAVFSRANVPQEAEAWSRIFADHVAGAIANARAFDEIRQLKAQFEQQNAYLQEEVVEAKAFGDLLGQSAALRQIVSQIDLVAPTEASVLILGETGTGKELVAHEIHRRSRRKDKPLIRVNCASIPRELYESEFFGHAKGAFTGAIKDRAGRFEAAEGGTLFLDEIGEVPLDLQGKLLRALQDKSYERVGEDRTRRADVRIIAATNRDLKKETVEGRFREDLYYRLNVFPIQVAPLRGRTEDIPLLARHFVESSMKELDAPKPRLTRAALVQLQSYDWPGNIRELRNVIERAVIRARGGVLEFDFPVSSTPPAARQTRSFWKSDNGMEFLTELEMQQRQRDNLLVVLEKTRWKIKGMDGAAELLGVKPTTLLSRIKKMGLERPR